MLDDLSDSDAPVLGVRKRLERVAVTAGSGDNSHPGLGTDSIQIGGTAYDTRSIAIGSSDAQGQDSITMGWTAVTAGDDCIAIGAGSKARDDRATSIGYQSAADGLESSAFGYTAETVHDYSTALGTNATTTASHQVMLGTSGDTVVVPGTFSNPSARHLKQNIIPAPDLRDIFPELTEWEYIDGDGRRRLGYIADDLVGTDAERFVTFDDEGRPAGIDYLSLLIVQNAQLHARLAALENNNS